ncbi:hypothetical protein [Salinisphaera sp.]|uniref:hypothetical protein n=1 Tax=Salinisphaera sp. TaxID=1914330 RepID=UPI002D797A1F|nr:hypothetical protein [Salinisphaera sp.]HET7315556.1 hypothetical protein [Salinisphaera sp.]
MSVESERHRGLGLKSMPVSVSQALPVVELAALQHAGRAGSIVSAYLIGRPADVA